MTHALILKFMFASSKLFEKFSVDKVSYLHFHVGMMKFQG